MDNITITFTTLQFILETPSLHLAEAFKTYPEQLGSVFVLGFVEQTREVLKALRIIGALLAVAVMIISGVMFATGRVESAVYGVVASGLLGLSAVIVQFLFSLTGEDPGIFN